ncbi:DUF4355 domain-containing protein [Dolosigranulum pigrum]|uniref:DUF4355 domain-containing protein n=1 Tax=Dolosigranulum pigrum TaxID=29394 RepID=UPI001AD86B2C|nr:DUF4355 domain-containing protein [Dolosigranulum pigrum]QTJ54268.1 DUF4355 domain-containing protein [Dolosigranulum pigrum]
MSDEMKKALQEKEQQQEASTAEESSGSVEFTQEQQEHVNRLVAQAKSKAKDEAKKDREEAIKEALAKEKDYAKLSEKERERQEFEDERQKFEQEKEAFEYRHLVLDVKQDLAEKDLPSEFAEFLAVKGDSEQSLENVGAFKKAFDKAVEKAVKESVKQPSPKEGGIGQSDANNLGARLAKQRTHSSGKIFEED